MFKRYVKLVDPIIGRQHEGYPDILVVDLLLFDADESSGGSIGKEL
ncbi:MAG: hypothetical protein V2B20_20060 [Pseudomonadota bacterium]